jgi:alpha-glucosidase
MIVAKRNSIMKQAAVIAFLLLGKTLIAGEPVVPGSNVVLQSPDKNYTVTFFQEKVTDSTRNMFYAVTYKGKPFINKSALDIQLDNHLSESAMALKLDRHPKWCENFSVKKTTSFTKDTIWKPLYGEQNLIRENYNAIIVEMVKDDNRIYLLNVEIRAYNEGIALRYSFPENEKGTYYRVMAENTEFSLPAGTMAWHAAWGQAPYKLLPLKNWPDEAERPLTLQLPNGLFACLAEAQMVDYARTKFKLSDKPNTIVTSMYTPADMISPFHTPWRVMMAAERAGELIENNSLILNLNVPSKIKDANWVKPGKIIRVMTQTTDGAKAYIDFCAQHNLQYILFDWKWYGPAFTFESDASKVVAPMDMPGIIEYAKAKGIGVWLYVNLQAMYSQSDSLFAIYKKWGIKGVKIGFVQVGSHRWTTWLQEMFKKAAENNIMLNVHDDWRPTGEQRTWPNLVTAEGVRGNEEMPDATNNTILPFTRYIAGPADYTICYFDKRIKTTHAHQLAMAAICYSPIQTLYWYDKPAAYSGEPELNFWDKISTTWDDTKIIQGQPGQFITTAIKNVNDWFVVTITNTEARSLKVSLSFLEAKKKYIATIYSDDNTIGTLTKVKVEEIKVDAATVLDVKLLASGGQAIWIRQQ